MYAQNDESSSRNSYGDELERQKFADRLKSLIPSRGERAFSAKAGISTSGLRGALKNGNPGREMMIAIARAAGVSLEWLATGEGPREPSSASSSLSLDRDDRMDGRQEYSARTEKIKRNQATDSTGAVTTTRGQLPLFPKDFDRLAACLAAAQRLPDKLDAQDQLKVAYRVNGLIDFLVAQGGREDSLDQEDIAALAFVLHKMIGKN